MHFHPEIKHALGVMKVNYSNFGPYFIKHLQTVALNMRRIHTEGQHSNNTLISLATGGGVTTALWGLNCCIL